MSGIKEPREVVVSIHEKDSNNLRELFNMIDVAMDSKDGKELSEKESIILTLKLHGAPFSKQFRAKIRELKEYLDYRSSIKVVRTIHARDPAFKPLTRF